MDLNGVRYVPGQRAGHYESFYQRANHPTRPLAFWIRYTILSPKDRPEAAVGELWAVFFDGETGRHAVAKEEFPLAACSFEPGAFGGRVSDSVLAPGLLRGSCGFVSWDLRFHGDKPPLYLLPERLYTGGFPKAKSMVGLPLAVFDGRIAIGERTIDVSDWVGSQNHNWGSRHTDRYAFGQVAGFDNAPDSFLEVVTAQANVGPLRTPYLTFLVVRHAGAEHALVSLRQAHRARARYGEFFWDFTSANDDVRIEGTITARPEDIVEFTYGNPPGGTKTCRNTKIGACSLTVTNRTTGTADVLTTDHRALLELLS